MTYSIRDETNTYQKYEVQQLHLVQVITGECPEGVCHRDHVILPAACTDWQHVNDESLVVVIATTET